MTYNLLETPLNHLHQMDEQANLVPFVPLRPCKVKFIKNFIDHKLLSKDVRGADQTMIAV